jgi:maltooligosyltrehalose trehalohydrolase
VICDQNHDQVGNRFGGERLSRLVGTDTLRLVAGVLLLAPYVPLLFMGEEYGEVAPFNYFVSHTDPELVDKVRRGRREEFATFGWSGAPPDPQDEATFLGSKLDHRLKKKEQHRSLMELYRELLRLRMTHPALRVLSKDDMEVVADGERSVLTVRRWAGAHHTLAVFNFGAEPVEVPLEEGEWTVLLDSSDEQSGPGGAGTVSARSFVLLTKEGLQ